MKKTLVFLVVVFCLDLSHSAEISGNISGYQTKDYDDRIDFGFVMPLQSKADLLNFNFENVLSSKFDVIRVVGQKIEIPSNISLPNQKERYFLSVRFNKPAYRFPLQSQQHPQYLGVLEGYFPFNKTVKSIQSGESLFNLVNSFTFKSYTTKHFETLEQDLEVGYSSINRGTYEVQAPQPQDPNYTTIGINLSEVYPDAFFPIDIKRLEHKAEFFKKDGLRNRALFAHIPKSLADSSASNLFGEPFSFSIAFGDPKPVQMLPLGKDFISGNGTTFYFNTEEISQSFSISAYSISFFDKEKNLLSQKVYSGAPPQSIRLTPTSNVNFRIDVFAIDKDPFALSILEQSLIPSAIPSYSKYVSRYEIEL